MKPVALPVLLCLSVSLSTFAEMYKWKDKDGDVTYSDRPPPANAKVIEKKTLGDNVIETDTVPFAAQSAAGKFPVTLYANDCGDPCTHAQDLLAKRYVPFAQKNPATSPDDAAALKRLVGKLEVPVLLVGANKPLRGFDEAQWNSALDAAGYPKAGSASAAKPIAKVRAGPANGAASQTEGEKAEAANGAEQAPGLGGTQAAPVRNAAEAPATQPARIPAAEASPTPSPPASPPAEAPAGQRSGVPAAGDSKEVDSARKRQQN
jgi:hypothetical protein